MLEVAQNALAPIPVVGRRREKSHERLGRESQVSLASCGEREMNGEHRKATDHPLEGIVEHANRPIVGDRDRGQRDWRLTIVHEDRGIGNQDVYIRDKKFLS